MEDSESKESTDDHQKRSLKSDRFFQASLVIILLGLVIIPLSMSNFSGVPTEQNASSLVLHQFGFYIALLGILLLIAALGNYVSKRMSDKDFWWVIKTGPFPQPT